MFNKLNIQVLIEMIIEFFIGIILAINLYTGNINNLIHPKFNPILWFSVFIMVLMLGGSSIYLFRPRHMNILGKYFVIAIPILVLVYVKTDSFNFVADINSYAQMSMNLPEPTQNLDSIIKPTVYKRKAGQSYIDISDDMYLKWYYDSSLSWDKYKGEKFKFLARVFKDKSQNKEFIVLGRMGMICCMADMQPCGFIYKGQGFENMKDGQWYYVTGNIVENNKYTYNYEKLAQIINVSIEEARKPTDEYVYIR